MVGVWLACFLVGGTFAGATEPVEPRLSSSINNADRFALSGSVRPAVERAIATQQGRLARSHTLPNMVLHFSMTAAQRADLEKLLKDQQDRRSPNYHRFLTPEEFGARFGANDGDIGKTLAWLHANGFWEAEVARGKTSIRFSGTAEEAEAAFHTTLYHYELSGQTYYANATEPQLPKAFKGFVRSIDGLHNFGLKPPVQRLHPDYSVSIMTHYITPDDWGTIYNVKPLWGRGINGSGVKIAVVGQSDVRLSDLRAFRAAAQLSPKDPTIIVPPHLTDPGIQTSTGDEAESAMDLELAGALAPEADIIFVTASATTGGGVGDSLAYAIHNNVAPIISISYGLCEQEESAADFTTEEALFQQANAQGITVVAASGDHGAATCDDMFTQTQATHGYAVSYPASSASVTAIGGTMLDSSTMWGTTNNAAGGSAVGYVPETGWSYGGGGASIQFAKPGWQSGQGVPADNARDLPDIAFAAATGTNSGYIVCLNGSCQNGFLDSNNNPTSLIGTSAPTPAFAGILALVIQQGGVSGLGNINSNLYSLAQFSTNIFHDVTSGTNDVACAPQSTGCPASQELGFSAGVGYDEVTGWGSVDATQFADQWFGDFQIAASPSSLTLQPGTSASVNVSLTPQNNFNGAVTYTCSVASSLIDVTCSAPSGPVTGSGAATITITAASTARSPWWRRIPPVHPPSSFAIWGAICLALVAVSVVMIRRHQSAPAISFASVVAATCAVIAISCGGSSGGGSNTTTTPKFTLSCSFPAVDINTGVYDYCTPSGGSGPYTFSVAKGTLPTGLALNPYTGVISGSLQQVGTYSFTIGVTDSETPAQSATFDVTNWKIGPTSPLAISCNLPTGALTGVSYSGWCTGSGGRPTLAGYTFTVVGGALPPGLTLYGGGGIGGVPTTGGTSSFTIQAADAANNTVTQTINNFVVGVGPLISVTCGNSWGYTYAMFNRTCVPLGGQPPFHYSLSGALPQGLTLNPSTGTISGVPATDLLIPGLTLTLTATDSSSPAQTASTITNFVIFDIFPLSVFWDPIQSAPLGLAGNYGPYISGGNQPYTMSLVSGQLPPGLTLDATGQIHGTPTLMGTFPLTIQVVDSSIPPFSKQSTGSITVGPRQPENGAVTITATSGNVINTATVQVYVP